MNNRFIFPKLLETLSYSPAVALLGPRQVGKTTLALALGKHIAKHVAKPTLYLDLESEQDRAKLANAELYLSGHQDKLVILDEVHRAPNLFPVLRGLIDNARRANNGAGLYLLLGSASLDLLKQAAETLAGRIAYMELAAFNILEVDAQQLDYLWVRGGFPDSFLAKSEIRSLRWRQDFIRSYLERDIPQFGPRIATETLRRFWGMLAHHQGGLLNSAELARNLGIDNKTAASYLDLLINLLLVRRLPPWHANIGKRLTKACKVYVRDSGLIHALLNIHDKEALLSHPIIGKSWECFVIENILNTLPTGVQGYFYRTSGGAEIDLLLAWPNGELWAIEIKRSLSPKIERGFYSACADLNPTRKFVVYPGQEQYRMAEDITVTSLMDICKLLANSNN
jgi:predicted AAA+ superfamily ATPase